MQIFMKRPRFNAVKRAKPFDWNAQS